MLIYKDAVDNDDDLGFLYNIIINVSEDDYHSDLEKSFLVFRDINNEVWIVAKDEEDQEAVFSSNHLHEALNFLTELEEREAKEEWDRQRLLDN